MLKSGQDSEGKSGGPMMNDANAQSESGQAADGGADVVRETGEGRDCDGVGIAGENVGGIVQQLDQSEGYPYPLRDYVRRFLWKIVWLAFIRFSPSRSYSWRRFWVRRFGAKLADSSGIRPTTRIMHPWLLEMGEHSILSDRVLVYNLGQVTIGSHTCISQDVELCAGTHDHTIAYLPLIRSTVTVGSGVWLCSGAFIGPGVTVGNNCVVSARAVVNRDVPAGMIVAGNPATVVKPRVMKQVKAQGRRAGRLRVLHATMTVSKLGGGVATYVWSLADRLGQSQIDSVVVGLSDGQLNVRDLPRSDHVLPVVGVPVGPRALGYSRELQCRLDGLVADVDVVHLHGLRTVLGAQVRRAAARHDVPVVISPHGQLDSWVLARQRARKWVVDRLWEQGNFAQADLFHAVSEHEAKQFRAYGLNKPITVVPCGIDLDDYLTEPDDSVMSEIDKDLAGKRVILFLSGLSERKGLFELARVWGRLCQSHPDLRLVIGGYGELPGLAQAINQSGAGGATRLIGEVNDATKLRLLATADYVVLPSHSEAFAIVVAEALASKTPVITTTAVPWPSIREEGCGWWIDPTESALEAALREAMAQSESDRMAMGEAGRALVERGYSWERVAGQMSDVYRAVIARHAGQNNQGEFEKLLADI